jgi:hypothetical protein
MVAQATFQGTRQDEFRLLDAISHNCGCTHSAAGAMTSQCAAHAMLIGDQRALDGLLVYFHLADVLRAEEGTL